MTANPGIYRSVILILMFLVGPAAYGQACREWKMSEEIGQLQLEVKEASGIAASRKFPGRLYHINDSGDRGAFYITSLNGQGTITISVTGGKPADTEALSLGVCGNGGSCLYIGDIGDNERKRRTIDIIVVEEMETFPQRVMPKERLQLRYPDGAHDAESLAVHPDGTIYILTKEIPARLYKATPGSTMQTMVPVMTIDTGGFTATDMSIADDGTRLLILTYLYAVELEMDFVNFGTPRYRQRVLIQPLQQEESITYLPGSLSFVYTTERRNLSARIMRVDCGTQR